MAESSEPIAVTLTEDDIPGAKLSEPWEWHSNHAGFILALSILS